MRRLPVKPTLVILSGRDREKVQQAATNYGFDTWTTEWREVIKSPDVQVVDICTPPGTHTEIATAAAEAGKAVICEKPLAVTYLQAAQAALAVKKAGVLNAVGFNYRRLPAVSLMKQMIDQGAVGHVRLWRATPAFHRVVHPPDPVRSSLHQSPG